MGAVVGGRSALLAPRTRRSRAGPRCPCRRGASVPGRPAARRHYGAAALGPAACSKVTGSPRAASLGGGGRRRERGRLCSGPAVPTCVPLRRAERPGGSRGGPGGPVCAVTGLGDSGGSCASGGLPGGDFCLSYVGNFH